MEESERRQIVEAVILGSPEPISAQRVAAVIPYCKAAQVPKLVDALNADYIKHGRAFEIQKVAGGYQVRTLPSYAQYLNQIQPQRPLRLSKAALETLAIVAYRQPVTRADIEDIRGVDAGAVLRSLLERRLLKLSGHKEVPGRPMLYATSRRFLEVMGLDRLEDLPSLREIESLSPPETAAGVPTETEARAEVEVEVEADGEVEAAAAFASEAEAEAAAVLSEAEPVGKPH